MPGTDVPLSAWRDVVRLRVCRTPAAALIQRPETVLRPCFGPPDPPRDLRVVSNSGGTVTVSWTASNTKRYVLEAGATQGQADLLITNVGPAPTFTADRVKRGTYYVRVRGRNACGAGAPSNELKIVVE